MKIYFKTEETWLRACAFLVTTGVTFEAFDADYDDAKRFMIELTGGY